jgi:hypothetical protein
MKLPLSFLTTSTLAHMRTGETRYTMPWAMWVDYDLNCWLHPEYPAELQPGGTVSMRVERHEDGYHVFPGNETYQPCRVQPYMSSNDLDWIPVAGVS